MSYNSWVQERTKEYMFSVIEPSIEVLGGVNALLIDVNGKTYLDCAADSNCNLLGYDHPDIYETLISVLDKGLLHCSNSHYHSNRALFATQLCRQSQMDKVFFCNSGAEATEAAIKMARRWCNEIAHVPPVIAIVENDFHGRTLAALAASDVPAYYKRGYDVDPRGFTIIPFDDPAALMRQSEYVHVLLMDAIQGSNGDVRLYSHDWWDAVEEWQSKGNLVILDEVQTYGYRTGHLWAFKHHTIDIQPDIVYTAKGIAAGLPLGAVLARGEVCQTFNERSAHYSTFGGNILACAAAFTQLVYLLTHKEEIRTIQQELSACMNCVKEYPGVKEVRGTGSYWAIDTVANAFSVKNQLMEHGVLVQCHRPTHIKITPPLVSRSHDINNLSAALETCLG